MSGSVSCKRRLPSRSDLRHARRKRLRLSPAGDRVDFQSAFIADSTGLHASSPALVDTVSRDHETCSTTAWVFYSPLPPRYRHNASEITDKTTSYRNVVHIGPDDHKSRNLWRKNLPYVVHNDGVTKTACDDSLGGRRRSDIPFNQSVSGSGLAQEVRIKISDNEETGTTALGGPLQPSTKADLSYPTPESSLKTSQNIMPSIDVTTRDSGLALPHDTCFGVVLLTFQSSAQIKSSVHQVAVSMSAYGNMAEISFADSNKYVGLVGTPALSMLLRNPAVTLSATLSIEKSNGNNKRTSHVYFNHKSVECAMRILVCGQVSEKWNVAKTLSDAGLYLQHPALKDIANLKYDNPHFLLRHGDDMPSLEQLSNMSQAEPSDLSDGLDESSISLVMRVFDSEATMNSSLMTKVSDRLRSKLEDHQLVALAMMQEKECGVIRNARSPSLWQPNTNLNGDEVFRNTVNGVCESSPKPARGGILADEMGLGKTLSILSLICWSLDQRADDVSTNQAKASGMTLVVTPKSTINGWQEQVERHIKPGRVKVAVFHGTTRKCFSKSQQCDIILTTYETMRSDWSTAKTLYSRQWDRIVLDEAHHIRTASSQVFKAACALRAAHRWCLTGTPICNSLTDYGSLLTFVGVQPFADRRAFNSCIIEPVKNKRQDGLNRLESLVRATCLRRKKLHKGLRLELPSQSERIHWVELSLEDQELYDFFKIRAAKLAVDRSLHRSVPQSSPETGASNFVTLINVLRRICDHGQHLLPVTAVDVWNRKNDESFTSTQLQDTSVLCDMCHKCAQPSTNAGSGCEHVICTTCVTNSDCDLDGENVSCPRCKAELSEVPDIPRRELQPDILPSAKIRALLENIQHEQSSNITTLNGQIPTKSVWTKMLDLVQYHLEGRGYTVARIDGSCSLQQRSQAIRRFNDDSCCNIMLASIGSAGEGIDLAAANHVHLLEPHWNPMQEAQAINRVHRIGQRRAVHTVRYLTRNTIETYVQWIQKEKIRLINQSLDSVYVSQAEIDEQRWKKLRKYIGPVAFDTYDDSSTIRSP